MNKKTIALSVIGFIVTSFAVYGVAKLVEDPIDVYRADMISLENKNAFNRKHRQRAVNRRDEASRDISGFDEQIAMNSKEWEYKKGLIDLEEKSRGISPKEKEPETTEKQPLKLSFM